MLRISLANGMTGVAEYRCSSAKGWFATQVGPSRAADAILAC